MAISYLTDTLFFPKPAEANNDGLLAIGGDLSPERLILAYSSGIFPWYTSDPILWYSPDPRAIIEPRSLHIPRRLKQTLRNNRLIVSLDRAFDRVIDRCAEISRPNQTGTWITSDMIAAYRELHRLGFAHSCEIWDGKKLVGGLYGVAVGASFSAESMFFETRDASKLALVRLVRQLDQWDFALFDCQIESALLNSFGAQLWSRDLYLRELSMAVNRSSHKGSWQFESSI